MTGEHPGKEVELRNCTAGVARGTRTILQNHDAPFANCFEMTGRLPVYLHDQGLRGKTVKKREEGTEGRLVFL